MSHSSPQVDISPLRKPQPSQSTKAKNSPNKISSSYAIKMLSPASIDLGFNAGRPAFDTKSFKAAMLVLREKTKARKLNTSQSKKTAPTTPRNRSQNNASAYGLGLYDFRGSQRSKKGSPSNPSTLRDNDLKKCEKFVTASSMLIENVIIEEKGISEASTKESVGPKKKRVASEEKKKTKAYYMAKNSFESKKNKIGERIDTSSTEMSLSKKEKESVSHIEEKKPLSKSKMRTKTKSSGSLSCFTSPKQSSTHLDTCAHHLETETMHSAHKMMHQDAILEQDSETSTRFTGRGGIDIKEYLALKLELENMRKEKEADKKTIVSLQEEIISLYKQADKSKAEKSNNPETEGPESKDISKSLAMDSVKVDALVEIKQREIDLLKGQNETLKLSNEMLKNENLLLKQVQKQLEFYKEEAKKYKEMALTRYKGEHALTEEGASLKKDFKRAKSSVLHLHRADSSYSNLKIESFNDADSMPSRIDSKLSLDNFHAGSLENFLSEADHNLLKVLEEKSKGMN